VLRPDLTRAGYTVLLVLLGTTLVFGPLLKIGSAARFWTEFITVAVMAAAVVKLSSRRAIRIAAVVAGGFSLTASIFQLLAPADLWIIARHASSVIFVLMVAGSITHSVWHESVVTVDTIIGGIAVYILLAVAWSAGYQLVEFVRPGSFVPVNGEIGRWGPWEPAPGLYPRLLFFSFITLTTLGYGDIVPASILAAGLASAEAVVGPLYLTILISRLVGFHVAGLREGTGGSEPPG